MALKGARTIVVRGRTFKWKFKGHGGQQADHQTGAPRAGHIVAHEDIDRHGPPLCVELESKNWLSQEAHDMDTGHIKHVASIFPRDVRHIIQVALDAGWDTEGRPPSIEVDLTDYRSIA